MIYNNHLTKSKTYVWLNYKRHVCVIDSRLSKSLKAGCSAFQCRL